MRDLFATFEGPKARETGSRFKGIMMLANHPELAKAWLGYNVFLSQHLALPKRLVEVVILRVAWRYKSEYEWLQHTVIAEPLGLGEEHAEAIKRGPSAPIWSELERLCLQTVDELCDTSHVSDATWDALAKHLDKKQQLELLFVAGTYATLAWVFNAARVEPEDMGKEERRAVIFSPDNIYGQRGT